MIGVGNRDCVVVLEVEHALMNGLAVAIRLRYLRWNFCVEGTVMAGGL